MTVLVFDSGVGGLSIFRELQLRLPGTRFVYVGDDAGFPYGDWEEEPLTRRIVGMFDHLIERFQPAIAIVACNTASTLIMPALRERFDIPFVGTVPAVKPAAERTASGLVTLLGTPGTVARQYIRELINQYASEIEVHLVGAQGLAQIAEDYLMQRPYDEARLQRELRPCFVRRGQQRTDIVILGCTHYPFLANQMRKLAPWPVDWIDPAEAIALRTCDLLRHRRGHPGAQSIAGSDLLGTPNQGTATQVRAPQGRSLTDSTVDLAVLTNPQPSAAAIRLMQTFGLKPIAMPEILKSAVW